MSTVDRGPGLPQRLCSHPRWLGRLGYQQQEVQQGQVTQKLMLFFIQIEVYLFAHRNRTSTYNQPYLYPVPAVLRSRSVFDRFRVFFSPAPTPAPIKSRLLTILNFFNIPSSLLEKILLVLAF